MDSTWFRFIQMIDIFASRMNSVHANTHVCNFKIIIYIFIVVICSYYVFYYVSGNYVGTILQ